MIFICPPHPSASSGQVPSASSGQVPSASSGQALAQYMLHHLRQKFQGVKHLKIARHPFPEPIIPGLQKLHAFACTGPLDHCLPNNRQSYRKKMRSRFGMVNTLCRWLTHRKALLCQPHLQQQRPPVIAGRAAAALPATKMPRYTLYRMSINAIP